MNGHMLHKQTISEAIYVAKGIGIVLVVVGHFQIKPFLPDYWEMIRTIIYSFHMPLFMALSGYLLGQSLPAALNIREYYSSIIKKKIKRILYPYITLSLLLLLAEVAGGLVANLQYPVDASFFKYILLNPMGGFSTLLWFLYALFVIYLIFPLFRIALQNDIVLLIAALGLSYFQWPEEFCLNLVMHHLPFFIGGYLAFRHNLLDILPLRLALPAFLCLFITSIFLKMQVVFPIPAVQQTLTLASGYAGIFIVIIVSLFITAYNEYLLTNRTFLIFKNLGFYSSGIYLLHTFCMGPVRIFLENWNFTANYSFLVAVIIVCATGLIAPIFIEIKIINQLSLARKLILGAK